ncbi:MAG: helix-turn-helix domain-containing protein [Pseudomonadota bacterium]|nr:helix-turn-helix domain-containing protein [Pseudomonadota bacterium]
MNTESGPLVVVELPGGIPAAFPMAAVMEARQRAAELGFGQHAMQRSGDLNFGTERLVDSKQLAELFGINDTFVEQLAKDGRLPSIRIGRLLRFQPSLCLAALRTNGGRL